VGTEFFKMRDARINVNVYEGKKTYLVEWKREWKTFHNAKDVYKYVMSKEYNYKSMWDCIKQAVIDWKDLHRQGRMCAGEWTDAQIDHNARIECMTDGIYDFLKEHDSLYLI
jgi:hypothetical protein